MPSRFMSTGFLPNIACIYNILLSNVKRRCFVICATGVECVCAYACDWESVNIVGREVFVREALWACIIMSVSMFAGSKVKLSGCILALDVYIVIDKKDFSTFTQDTHTHNDIQISIAQHWLVTALCMSKLYIYACLYII